VKPTATWIAVLAGLLLTAGGVGYWIGSHRALVEALPWLGRGTAVTGTAATEQRPILYYKHPGGSPEFSPVPKKDEQGRPYLPVYEDEDAQATPVAAPPPREKPGKPAGKGRILYYRNPMGLPDISPEPKKDPMGMAYVPVYEGETEDEAGTVRVSPERVQRLGVRVETVARLPLRRTVRAVGTVQFDERRMAAIAPKFEGWIEGLIVNTAGQAVAKGEPLMRVYSPDLMQAQQEYLIALGKIQDLKDSGADTQALARRLADGALRRLRYLDIPEEDLARLQRDGAISRRLTLSSPIAGVVTEKKAIEGMRFMPGEALYQIADLSHMWVVAEVFEQDLALVRAGQEARVAVTTYPGRTFSGQVAFIYPTVSAESRTARLRVELANPDGALKANMFASVEIAAAVGGSDEMAVPDSAVLDSGVRQVVLVERAPGLYAPRPVRLGPRNGGYVQVLSGLELGERIVVGANFLIDAESNFRAALQTFAPPAAPARREGP